MKMKTVASTWEKWSRQQKTSQPGAPQGKALPSGVWGQGWQCIWNSAHGFRLCTLSMVALGTAPLVTFSLL